MRISYNWLKEHLPLGISAEELAERLPLLGFSVAAMEHQGPGFSGVIVGKVLSVDKHPNADRLSLCVVDDGTQKHPVVCGAKNVAVGQTVPLARVGAILPGGFQLTKSKIRGVESHGMICSVRELGLGEEADGIWAMDTALPVGSDLAKSLGQTDCVLDVEITPNRPDCLSHLGLARELSAFLHIPLKTSPQKKLPEGTIPCLDVQVQDPKACPRYVGRSFEGLRIAASPGWLAAKLEAVGLRPIHNLVDITNFLLMDLGQPMHAFDADKLEGGLVVRFARPGEKIIALDDKQYTLTERCLVIADQKKPVAIAGVMGGRDTAVTQMTKRAFLESATFDPTVVRRTSQALRLKSDSSYRFERGTDPGAAQAASQIATELIQRLCATPDLKISGTIDRDSVPAPKPIDVTSSRLNAILGTSFSEAIVESTLKPISAQLEKSGPAWRFTPPSYRRDLATPWDLAEELARLTGYDQIPYRETPIVLKSSSDLPSQTLADKVRGRLVSLGFSEAYNLDFISDKLAAQARLSCGLVRVKNPISEDYANMRPTLLTGLLQNARLNLNNGAQTLRLFELGKTYVPRAKEVAETTRAAGLLLGPAASHWKSSRGQRLDFYDAKGAVEELLAGVAGIGFLPLSGAEPMGADPLFHPVGALRLRLPSGILGTVGLLHPTVARAWEMEREEVCIFELDLDLLAGLHAPAPRFAPFSVFPGSTRDISFLVDTATPYDSLAATIRQPSDTQLKGIDLVDKFTGKGVPQGKQSLTIRLSFGRDDRTLQDAEVTAAVETILAKLSRKHGAVLRT